MSFFFTILAIIGIWKKDRLEFWGTGHIDKVGFRDYLSILKHNMPLKMLVIAASTDKIGLLAVRAGQVYLFSNILLNSAWNGTYALWALIPTLLIVFGGVAWARHAGLKKILIRSSSVNIGLGVLLMVLTPILSRGLTPGASITVSVLVLLVTMALFNGTTMMAGNIVTPMIADCIDYETYRSGKFKAGMIGTLFGFVDKVVSSLSTFIVGAAIAWAGLGQVKIVPNTFLGDRFVFAIVFILFGLLVLGNIATLIAMKWYRLDAKEMVRINQEIQDRKAAESNV